MHLCAENLRRLENWLMVIIKRFRVDFPIDRFSLLLSLSLPISFYFVHFPWLSSPHFSTLFPLVALISTEKFIFKFRICMKQREKFSAPKKKSLTANDNNDMHTVVGCFSFTLVNSLLPFLMRWYYHYPAV